MRQLLALRESFYLSLQMTFCGFVLANFPAMFLNVANNIKIESNKSLQKTFFPSRTAHTQIANYPDRLSPKGKFVENSTKLSCLEITSYRIKYSTVLWLIELQIRRGRQDYTQVHTVNSNSRTANCQCSLLSKKNPIIGIFCISGWLAVPVNPDKWSSSVFHKIGSVQTSIG